MPTRPAAWTTGKERKGSANSLLNNGFNNTDTKRFQMNAALKWQVPWVQGLSATASLNYTTTHSMNKKFSYDQESVYDNPLAKWATNWDLPTHTGIGEPYATPQKIQTGTLMPSTQWASAPSLRT